ncbi:hypothetical protein Salat_1142800 [Sesamum alatum]|uniref:Uncharacterized protein n=1 Tax=Sesamum alatum TaxID=300844 RepID=A0AAE2CN92_9LAMI|nr:hypothetical protein Salat_1142800 [Sesamum alatum]
MSETIHNTTKKTFYYNFFPTKAEEESSKVSTVESRPAGLSYVMVEIRDITPPPVVDPRNPWRIKKTLNHHEIDSGKLVLSWNDMFDHVLRYWPIGSANMIALGIRVGVAIWDVTQEEDPRKYEESDACLQLQLETKDCFVLACMALMKDRNLKVYDDVSLYWDPKKFAFQFKLLL